MKPYAKMGRFRFVLMVVLFAGATLISAQIKSVIPELTKGPELELKFSSNTNNAGVARSLLQSTMPKGRLLTPEEGCGYSEVQNKRIVGGAPAKNGAWPWVALLGYSKANAHNNGSKATFDCGGSLITSRHVLSAAHCIEPNLFVVRLGEYDVRSVKDGPHEDILIDRADPHTSYHKFFGVNDIAMIYLEHDVDFTDRIRPICLPLIDEEVQERSFVGSNPFVAGWGSMNETGKRSPVLMQVQVPVITNEECLKKYDRIKLYYADIQFSSRVLCAGFEAGGKDTCHGDSGGPLMLPIHQNGTFPFYQIGVVSYGIGCARPNIPGIYANVQHYAKWIKRKLEV